MIKEVTIIKFHGDITLEGFGEHMCYKCSPLDFYVYYLLDLQVHDFGVR